MELKEYIAPLLKWWWLLIASTLVAAISSFLAVQRQPPIYSASTTLMIGRALDDPNPSGNEIWLGQQLATTYSDIAKRSPVREATKAALELSWLPEYIARPLNNTQQMVISVTDTDPARAQAVANELANQLILKSPTNPQEHQERQIFINQQLDELQFKIEDTQDEIDVKQEELGNMVSARQIADTKNQITALQTKLNTLQSNYTSLLSNTRQGALNTITVIEPASLPTKPIGPDVPMTVLTASTLGLVLAGSAAFLLEYLDNTIKSPNDVKKLVNLPTLAGIAHIRGERYPEKLVTIKHPRSPISEAYRSLRTAIQFSTFDRPGNTTLLVSSPNPTEGKSVTVANLAVVMAQAGYKVLIVDSDLRRPVMHRFFELPNSRGLTSFLLEVNPIHVEDDLIFLERDIIHNTPTEGLRVLTSGPIPPNPSELLGSEKMRKSVAALSKHYDYIVLDSPPTMIVTDAAVLSTLVHGVVLVADADRTQKNHLRQVMEHLKEVNANLIGVVLNRLSPKSDGYYYHYYYRNVYSRDNSYGYGYGQEPSITTNSNGRGLSGLLEGMFKRASFQKQPDSSKEKS
jgi:non-specific protein-tyrosine kinase